MKITLIHGQNHKGSTYHIASMLAQKLNSTVEEFFLPQDFGEGCSGCLACLHKGREFCPHAEKVTPIFASMLSSDAIILDSPTYVMEMTAHLKGFLEHIFTAWLAHRPEEAMFSKTAVVISTAAGMGMNGVTKSMEKQMFYLGIAKVYRLPFRVMASCWDEVDAKIKAKIDAKTSTLAHKIAAKNGRARPGIKTRFIFSMMRSFQKKNEYASRDKAYWTQKKWLEKARPWKSTSTPPL